MTPIIELLDTYARLDETLLLKGQSGTGKSRLAAWAHERSGRAGPLETVDLQVIPESTQVGELFGWRKGAFTGAEHDHEGFVGRAEGGTLFIDEIDKLSLRAQAALLQLLENKIYRRLGEQTHRRADVRFMIGTNVDLLRKVHQGEFREDLYYRVNVLTTVLPSLDDRKDEIADWARYMLRRRDPTAHFDNEALVVIEQSRWPGNLRQLDNVVRRAYAMACASPTANADAGHVGAQHVRQALGMERSMHAVQTAPPLTEAASAVAKAALERYRRKEVTDPRDVQGFWGLVLVAALEQGASVETIFEMFGRPRLVEGRNHHRTLRREAERAAKLLRCVQIAPTGRLNELLICPTRSAV